LPGWERLPGGASLGGPVGPLITIAVAYGIRKVGAVNATTAIIVGQIGDGRSHRPPGLAWCQTDSLQPYQDPRARAACRGSQNTPDLAARCLQALGAHARDGSGAKLIAAGKALCKSCAAGVGHHKTCSKGITGASGIYHFGGDRSKRIGSGSFCDRPMQPSAPSLRATTGEILCKALRNVQWTGEPSHGTALIQVRKNDRCA